MVTAYRWRLWDVVDWSEVGYLPLEHVSFEWRLNDIGALQASLPIGYGDTPIRPGEHAVIVERDAVPVWMGPIWPYDYDTANAFTQLRASEWTSYLRRRRVRVDRDLRATDQFDIARQLITDSQQAFPASSLRIDVYAGRGQAGRTLSGVPRDRVYKALERKEVWEALTQLGGVLDGFDQRLRPVYGADGAPALWWEGFYPHQGDDVSGIVLEYREGWSGSNVSAYRWPWSADDMANVTEATSDQAVATATDPGSWTTYPVLEAVAQKGGEHGTTDVATLQEAANGLLQERRLPKVAASLTLVPGFPALGPDLIGAQARVRLTSWRHPPGPNGEPGYDDTLRIEGISVNAPADDRPEEATVTLAPILWAT